MDNLTSKSHSNFLEKMESNLSQCSTFLELIKLFKINANDLIKIYKSDCINLESTISGYQKHLFLSYFKNFYTKYFIVSLSKTELLKQKTYRNSTKKIALKSLEAKQKMLAKLEQGFDFNYFGILEELRIERIKQLKKEIQLLKKVRNTTKKSNFQKPYARIIYTPMGGKVD